MKLWIKAGFAVLLIGSLGWLRADIDAELVSRAKAATAFVFNSSGSATAFCISESGLFVTNDHVISQSNGQPIRLALYAGLENEQIYQAEIVRRDEENDLAILKVDLGDSPPPSTLQLGDSDKLYETQEIIALGFPFGRNLSADENTMPSISINLGRVTSLRKQNGDLKLIQLDAQLNPGNSGGPVLNPSGKVIGVITSGVRNAGVNFAIPAAKLYQILEKPDLTFSIPEVTYDQRFDSMEATAEIVWLREPSGDAEAVLEISDGQTPARTFSLEHGGGNVYSGSLVPLPKEKNGSDPLLRARIRFPDGTIEGQMKDGIFRVGNEKIALQNVRTLIFGDESGRIQLRDGTSHEGEIRKLDSLNVLLGGETLRVSSANVTELSIRPPVLTLPDLTATLRILVDGKELHSVSQSLQILSPSRQYGEPASPLVRQVDLLQSREIPLPVEVYDLDSAGNGRYLILYLREARKLARFDMAQLEITGYINLKEENVVFGAGASNILVFYPRSNLLERYSLDTLENELTVSNPVGHISEIGFGNASRRYAMLLSQQSQRHDATPVMFDVPKMSVLDTGPLKKHGFLLGEQNKLRTSADGTVYGTTKIGSSPSGIGILTFRHGNLTSFYEHNSTHVVVPGVDGKQIFIPHQGIYTPKYIPILKQEGGWSSPYVFLPSYHKMYFLSVPSLNSRRHHRDEKNLWVRIFLSGSQTPLVTLEDEFDEMEIRRDSGISRNTTSPLTMDKRYHFVPQLNLFLTLPVTNDRLVARPVNIKEILDEKGIDYLYVISLAPPATPGTDYRYEMEAASKSGGVTYKLQSGPEDLTVSPQGIVQWSPPADARPETVIVTVSDDSGQEIFHTFDIQTGN